jgi:ribose transport system ATP-binding protein
MGDAGAALRLTGVRKTFGAVQALARVDFEVREGEVHALLGENGAGKSTLMAIAAGSLLPDEGVVEIGGIALDDPTPRAAQALGVGVVYQHPAVLEDLTVAENLALVIPPGRRPQLAHAEAWARAQLAALDADIAVGARGDELSAAQRQLVEIAKALALDPRVLILDEPTAALDAAEVELLFERLRAIRARGTAVVYISHRMPEVRRIADRVTVLRDGAGRGTMRVADVSDDEILNRILGRELEAVFPEKRSGNGGAPLLEVRSLAGDGFDDVSFTVRRGEIFGIAGAEGNGQRAALRALAGLGHNDGGVRLDGRPVALPSPPAAQAAGFYLVPADRQRESLLTSLSVRENAAVSSLAERAAAGLVGRRREEAAVGRALAQLDVRAASLDADVGTLSGGNQQKVVLARALLGAPRVLLCDEPTQGVDAGARVEIYRLLREQAGDDKAVVVLSSDAVELAGLCDRVAVFSRGHVVATLAGADVTEQNITGTAISSTQARREAETGRPASGRLRRLLRGEQSAAAILALLIVLLGAYTAARSDTYLTAFNFESWLYLAAALAFVTLGQLVVLLTGGIDLSVGPLMALTVVVLSEHLTEGAGTGATVVGLALACGVGVLVGLLNGLLVRKARISPIIATLATFIALQGVAQLLRPQPEGVLAASFGETLQRGLGFVPVALLAAALVACVAEYVLRRRPAGLAVRAAGSDESSAHRAGVRVDRTVIACYVVCSLFAVVAGVVLAGQVGIGDASVGQTYTLSSITAVVLGGASIYGGRGSFLSAFLGAVLVTQIINATTFLELNQAWQYWLPGALILVAAALFSRARGLRAAPLEAA